MHGARPTGGPIEALSRTLRQTPRMAAERSPRHDPHPGGELSRVRGLWVLTALPPFGFLAPLGFAYAAHRARAPSWYLWAAGWGLLTFTGLALNVPAVEDSDLDKSSSLLMMIAWVGAFVHALALRSEYVRRVRDAGRDPVLAARRRLEERRRAQELAREDPVLARELGIGRPDVRGAEAMGVVDVNHAGAAAIGKLPGLDRALAERIVAAREEIGGFSSAEDVGHVLHLDPHLVDGLRERTVYLPR